VSKGKKFEIALVLIFGLVVGVLWLRGIPAGQGLGRTAVGFGFNIFKVLPCAFVLIGLFEVWVKPETVEKHFGAQSGLQGHFWAMLLAGTTVGGLYVAFPVAVALYRKGARLAVIFAYIGAAAIVRIPMTIFEATFMGIQFTIIRLIISIPLVLVSAELLGRFLHKHGYVLRT